MPSLQSFLAEAKDMHKPKIYMDNKYAVMPKKKKKMAKMSSLSLLADFGVPLLQRWAIEASEGIKTLKDVAKDIATKKVYNDPRTKNMWAGDLGQGFAEARNRVQQSLRKTSDSNIKKELTKNKKTVQEELVRKMRSEATQKYKNGNLRDLAPTPRMEADGVLQSDKRFNIGKKDKTQMSIISEPTKITRIDKYLKSANK